MEKFRTTCKPMARAFAQVRSLSLVAIFLGAVVSATAMAASDDVSIAWKNAQKDVPGLSKDTVDAACKEGTMMLYSLVLRGKSKDVLDRFEARFPCIKLKTFYASGGPLARRFTSELLANNSPADIWMNSSPSYGDDLAKQNLLLNWTPPNASLIADLWKNEGYWYAIGLAHIGVAWNKDEINPKQKEWLDNLKTWDQLPSAPFAGSNALVDIRAGGSTQIFYYLLKEKYGVDFWTKLAALKPTIFSGVGPLAERLAAGEFIYGAGIAGDTGANIQWFNGAPLQWKYPEPGLAVPYFIAISAKSPHPNAAKLFMAWSLSVDGQNAWVNSSGLAPASTHVADERAFAKEPWYKLPKEYYRADWSAISSHLKDDVATFSNVFGK